MFFKQFSAPLSFLVSSIALIDTITAQSHYAITGLKTGINAKTGARPARRDILDLVKDLPSWSLYVQAMNQLMQTNETLLTSYFQIGGIHGRPYIAWDNVNPTPPTAGVPIGYCTHGNTLFPTWHRPYLALLEQVMGGFAQTIAKTYNSAVYQTAADNLRIPYWDWAAIGQNSFPDVMTWPSVQINTPTGLKNVTNPLYQYTFLSHPEPESWFPITEPGTDSWLGSQPKTLRWPDANNQSRNGLVNLYGFDDDGIYLTNGVWDTFARTKTYNAMSTTSHNETDENAFEGPHGTIHGFVGGPGHMSPVSFSGFDPAFWLHHAYVDRQIAMWQAIYPDAWITPSISQSGTWTISYNTQIDGNTPLTPFTTADKKTPWTSNSARYTKAFGYSYPDVKDWLFTNATALSANVTARVNQLYNTTPLVAKKRAEPTPTREWAVTVAVPNDALAEGFSVTVSVASSVVGKLVVMSTPAPIARLTGSAPTTNARYTITRGLEAVDTEDVDAVVANLKETLSWKVVKIIDGTEVPVDQVRGLEVVVQDVIVTPALDDSTFPVWGEKTLHPEVTA